MYKAQYYEAVQQQKKQFCMIYTLNTELSKTWFYRNLKQGRFAKLLSKWFLQRILGNFTSALYYCVTRLPSAGCISPYRLGILCYVAKSTNFDKASSSQTFIISMYISWSGMYLSAFIIKEKPKSPKPGVLYSYAVLITFVKKKKHLIFYRI